MRQLVLITVACIFVHVRAQTAECQTELTAEYWNVGGSVNWNAGADYITISSGYIETKQTYTRPITVQAEMMANSGQECISFTLFAQNHGKNSVYSFETGAWRNQIRIYPGDKRETVGYNNKWDTVKIELTDTHANFYFNDVLKHSVADTSRTSGTIQFIRGCTTMRVRNPKVLSGGGCTAKPQSTWVPVLTQISDGVTNGWGTVDVGEDQFNKLFAESGVIRRECPECTATHRVVYYVRITEDCDQFNAYYIMKKFRDADENGIGNRLNTNFLLTNDESVAVSSTVTSFAECNGKCWTHCNYNDDRVGGFRDCGPTSFVGGWMFYCTYTSLCKSVRWSILELASGEKAKVCGTVDPTSDPTVDPTADPTLDPTIDPTIDPTAETTDPTMEPTTNPTTSDCEIYEIDLVDKDNKINIAALKQEVARLEKEITQKNGTSKALNLLKAVDFMNDELKAAKADKQQMEQQLGNLKKALNDIYSFVALQTNNTLYRPPALVKKSCSVTVLSVDHKSGVDGKYFNFAKKDLDAILGRNDWSGDRLEVSNGKEVVVWRNPNGGSKGDAHGRWNKDSKPNQFKTGQKIFFC